MRQMILLLAITAIAPVMSASSPPPPPMSVAAIVVDPAATIVSWLPPPTTNVALTYHVYGVTTSGPVLLASTDGTAAVVSSGYEVYEVRALMDGQESSPASTGEACLETTLTPPPPNAWLNPACSPDAVYLHVMVPHP